MKYKIGDKVRIKSLDWYNQNKDQHGRVACGYHVFTEEMSKFCGCTMIVCNRTNLGVMTMGGITEFTRDSFKYGCETLEFNNSNPNLLSMVRFINQLIKNHFDIYGLIPMGLAIDATNKNIY